MQIDVLSQNTLKLTLSRLDMFDLDIKYESLSGKNPDTKRLLSHVLRTVKLDKSAGVDFSGERLFVEAFPRPDGGCMLYISSLTEEGKINAGADKKSLRLTAKSTVSAVKRPNLTGKPKESELLYRFDGIRELESACRNLSWQQTHNRVTLSSALYGNGGEYRLALTADNKKLITAIVSEFGELLDTERELPFTREHFSLLAADNAVEQLT
jgi:negative regulator of genetic competence, sporulation and motility